MTNYQTDIINEIKSRLTGLTTFKLVGEYPEDNHKFGTQYPVAFVVDEAETFSSRAGNILVSEYDISIFISCNDRIKRVELISDLQARVITAILTGDNLSGLAGTVDLVSIEKGEYSNQLEKFDIGYNESKTNRRINFKIGVCNYAC